MASAVDEHCFPVCFFLFLEPVSEMEERLDHLRVSAPHARHDSYSESEETGSYSDRRSSATVELPSAFQFYIKGMVSTVTHHQNILEHQG